jgi:S1-C subfamily serine protease
MATAKSDKDNLLSALSNGMVEAVARAGQTTVLVKARRRFPASGIGYQADLVLTANHVVERDEDITIVLPDRTESQAQVVGRDPGSDLALLRLEKADVKPAQPALHEARVGQLALALGRPSLEGIQASLGVVSGIGGPVRTMGGGLLERFLRIDVTPYPGFSGGPLVDTAGGILGINTSGLGWRLLITIPIHQAWQVAAQLAEHGHVLRGHLGIRSQLVELPGAAQQALGREQVTGLLLVWVDSAGPGGRAGLIVGDILVGMDGQPILDHDELLVRLAAVSADQTISIQILRGGQMLSIPVTIDTRYDSSSDHRSSAGFACRP